MDAIFQNFFFFSHVFLCASEASRLYTYGGVKPPFVAGLVGSIVLGFGGGSIVSILTGTKLSYFSEGKEDFWASDFHIREAILVWAFVYYFPKVRTFVFDHPIGKIVIGFPIIIGAMHLKITSAFSGVDKSLKAYPDSLTAALVLGTLASCGGGLTTGAILKAYHPDFKSTASEFWEPTRKTIISFVSALSFAVIARPFWNGKTLLPFLKTDEIHLRNVIVFAGLAYTAFKFFEPMILAKKQEKVTVTPTLKKTN